MARNVMAFIACEYYAAAITLTLMTQGIRQEYLCQPHASGRSRCASLVSGARQTDQHVE